MSGIFLPFAQYIGLGVTEMSAVEYILNHQNIFATVNDEFSRCNVSQALSPYTKSFACCQKRVTFVSLSYQPFDTMPWSLGGNPVSIELCTVLVTAGSGGSSEVMVEAFASAVMFGVCSPR